jgi:hypothetical protein
MPIRFPGWIARLSKWAGDASPNNGGATVLLSATEQHAQAVATDGRRIAIVRAKHLADGPAEAVDPFCIAADELADAASAIGCSRAVKPAGAGGRPEQRDRQFCIDSSPGAGRASDAIGGEAMPIGILPDVYPDWRGLERVIEADVAREHHTVDCDPRFLAELAEIAKAAGATRMRLTLTEHADRIEMIVATFTTRDGVDALLAIAGMGPAEQLEERRGRPRRGANETQP